MPATTGDDSGAAAGLSRDKLSGSGDRNPHRPAICRPGWVASGLGVSAGRIADRVQSSVPSDAAWVEPGAAGEAGPVPTPGEVGASRRNLAPLVGGACACVRGPAEDHGVGAPLSAERDCRDATESAGAVAPAGLVIGTDEYGRTPWRGRRGYRKLMVKRALSILTLVLSRANLTDWPRWFLGLSPSLWT